MIIPVVCYAYGYGSHSAGCCQLCVTRTSCAIEGFIKHTNTDCAKRATTTISQSHCNLLLPNDGPSWHVPRTAASASLMLSRVILMRDEFSLSSPCSPLPNMKMRVSYLRTRESQMCGSPIPSTVTIRRCQKFPGQAPGSLLMTFLPFITRFTSTWALFSRGRSQSVYRLRIVPVKITFASSSRVSSGLSLQCR